MLTASERLAKKRNRDVEVYGFVTVNAGLEALIALITTAGIDLRTDSQRFRLDDPKVMAVLHRFATLRVRGAIYTWDGEGQQPSEEARDLINAQRAGIWVMSPQDLKRDGQTPPLNVGIAAVPAQPEVIRYFYDVERPYYIMSAQTQHADAAWRWLSYLSHVHIEPRETGSSPDRAIPARKSLAASSSVWQQLNNEEQAVIRSSAERLALPARSALVNPEASNRVIQALMLFMGAINTGKDVETAAREVQAILDGAPASTPKAQLRRGR